VTQVDHVEKAILSLLVQRDLAPGDRLPPERDLVTRTGASRAAVREAIVRLCHDRLLVSRRGSGTYVASVDVAAISAVRALLEPAAAAAAAELRTETQARALERLLGRMSDSVEQPGAFATADEAIHSAVAAACGNPVLEDAIGRLARNAAVSRAVTSPQRIVRERTLADVTELVSAIIERRPAAAREAMHRHLTRLGETSSVDGPRQPARRGRRPNTK
jgi:GntR family transcriptional regulator, transcriptional repressor for pyruvate dehydrogenase complex